jgi:hypothetical protein
MVRPLTGYEAPMLGSEVLMSGMGLERKKCNEDRIRIEKPGVDPGKKEKGAGKIRDGPASQGPQKFQQLVRFNNSIV